MAAKNDVILVENLKKNFGSFEALKGISLHVKQGEVLGFLGPNGAGKTTTIQILLGITRPTSGSVKLLGLDIVHDREAILSQVNYVSAYVSLIEKLTVYENLSLFARLYSVTNARKKIDDLLETFRIGAMRHKSVGNLSAGQKTRVSFAKALLNDPKILLLDEPMASLDPEAADRARTMLKEIQRSRDLSLLYTSHNMAEVEQICDRVIFLNHGEIVAQGTPHEVTRQVLKRAGDEPDLEQVFITLARSEDDESF